MTYLDPDHPPGRDLWSLIYEKAAATIGAELYGLHDERIAEARLYAVIEMRADVIALRAECGEGALFVLAGIGPHWHGTWEQLLDVVRQLTALSGGRTL